MAYFTLVVFVCLVLCAAYTNAQGSNCYLGEYCDQCPSDRVRYVQLSSGQKKVCCPNCHEYIRAGNRWWDGQAWCSCYYASDIEGDCWKAEQCDTCLQGPNASYVGSINTIPVCCQQCERSGMSLSPNSCNCLHNGA